MLSGFETLPYRLNSVDGPPVDIRYWESASDQVETLKRTLSDLERDGIKRDQITILSKRKLPTSVASHLESAKWPIVDLATVAAGMVASDKYHFATIQSFKGLETPVAVLVDMEGMEEAERHALLYVGMSRARTCLVMLLHQSFRRHVERSFRRRIEGH